jgi:hypothetical protein
VRARFSLWRVHCVLLPHRHVFNNQWHSVLGHGKHICFETLDEVEWVPIGRPPMPCLRVPPEQYSDAFAVELLQSTEPSVLKVRRWPRRLWRWARGFCVSKAPRESDAHSLLERQHSRARWPSVHRKANHVPAKKHEQTKELGEQHFIKVVAPYGWLEWRSSSNHDRRPRHGIDGLDLFPSDACEAETSCLLKHRHMLPAMSSWMEGHDAAPSFYTDGTGTHHVTIEDVKTMLHKSEEELEEVPDLTWLELTWDDLT